MILLKIDSCIDVTYRGLNNGVIIMQASTWHFDDDGSYRDRADGYYFLSRNGKMMSFSSHQRRVRHVINDVVKDCI